MKERILQFIENKGISKNKFYIETGVSNGILDKKSGLSMDTVEKIYSKYPEINLEWLLTGNGEMLRGNTEITQNGSNNTNKGHNISGNKNRIEQTNDELLELLKKKDEQIDRLLSMLENK